MECGPGEKARGTATWAAALERFASALDRHQAAIDSLQCQQDGLRKEISALQASATCAPGTPLPSTTASASVRSATGKTRITTPAAAALGPDSSDSGLFGDGCVAAAAVAADAPQEKALSHRLAMAVTPMGRGGRGKGRAGGRGAPAAHARAQLPEPKQRWLKGVASSPPSVPDPDAVPLRKAMEEAVACIATCTDAPPLRPAGLLHQVLRAWDAASLLVRCIGILSVYQLGCAAKDFNQFLKCEVSFALPLWYPHYLYVIGGLACSDIGPSALGTVERLNVNTGVWEALPSLRQARRYASAAALGGCIYVIGGCSGEDPAAAAIPAPGAARRKTCVGSGAVPTPSVECFVADRRAWMEVPPLLQARYGAAAAAYRGMIFAVGGHDGSRPLASAERWCPARGAWEAAPQLQTARMFAAASVQDRCLFVLGGTGDDGCPASSTAAAASNSVECLREEAGEWHLEELPGPRRPRPGAALAVSRGGMLLSVAGRRCLPALAGADALPDGEAFERAEPLADVEGLTSAGSGAPWSWVELPHLRYPRLDPVAVGAGGDVYVLGGDRAKSESAVERWSSQRAAWELLPALPTPRLAIAATAARV